MTNFDSLLQNQLPSDIDAKQRAQLVKLLQMLEKWNKSFNLTAITDPREMVSKHIVDSLSVRPYLRGRRIIDVGTGAGFPGLPLAIVEPDRRFVLLDSNGKKIRFIRQTLLELCLENVEIVEERAEIYHPESCFDTVVTRAFSAIPDMLLSTRHLCCKNGLFIAMKGEYPAKELSALSPDFSVKEVVELTISGLEAARHLVLIQFKQK